LILVFLDKLDKIVSLSLIRKNTIRDPIYNAISKVKNDAFISIDKFNKLLPPSSEVPNATNIEFYIIITKF